MPNMRMRSRRSRCLQSSVTSSTTTLVLLLVFLLHSGRGGSSNQLVAVVSSFHIVPTRSSFRCNNNIAQRSSSIHHVQRTRIALSPNNSNDEEEKDVVEESEQPPLVRNKDSIERRQFLQTSLTTALIPLLFAPLSPARAMGLVMFPCDPGDLLNTYHFLRAGTSLLEEEQDIWSTNPLFLTNRDDALSMQGQEQVVVACGKLKGMNILPTVVRYSLAASCMDTANVVARELRLGRDRVVAEYTYLDPRGIGKWDMLSKQVVQPAVWAMDNDEAGINGIGGRPPPNDDGTPHETLADQAVRLRQEISVLETLYSGDTILLIFPDGTGPALLSALMAGVPLNRVHELEYYPGELRLDVTRESTLDLWQTKQQDGSFYRDYQELLKQGRQTLQELRTTAPDDIVSIKDQKLESDRIAMEEEFQEKKRKQQVIQEAEKTRRTERQQQIAAARQQQQQGDGATLSPVAIGAAGMVAFTAVGLAVAPPSGERDRSLVMDQNGASSSSSDNVTGSIGFELVDPQQAPTGVGSPVVNGGGLYASARTTSGRQRVNGDRNGTLLVVPPPTTPQDRLEAANQAMDEYMNRDDGGEDWLQSLTDILEEDEDVWSFDNT